MRFWEKLLIEHRALGKSGLTIPYLIGSQNFLPNDFEIINIESLITECVVHSSLKTCMRYCSYIKELILEIKKEGTPVFYPIFKGREQNNFSLSIFNKDLGDTTDKIINKLNERYEKKLIQKLYSVQANDYGRETIWTDFIGSEIEFIKNCFLNL